MTQTHAIPSVDVRARNTLSVLGILDGIQKCGSNHCGPCKTAAKAAHDRIAELLAAAEAVSDAGAILLRAEAVSRLRKAIRACRPVPIAPSNAVASSVGSGEVTASASKGESP